MCIDPATAMMVVGTGMNMFGAANEGRETESEYKGKALDVERKLEQERQKHATQRKKQARNSSRKISNTIARQAERGIAIEGSSLDLIEDQAKNLDLEQSELDREFSDRREDMTFEASRFRRTGRLARKKARVDMIGKAVEGGTRLVSGF